MILSEAQLTNYRPRKDKSISLTFITGEKTPAQVMEFHTKLDSFGYLAFKDEEMLTDKELQEIDSLDTDIYDSPKTQSQRIRNVLYLNWKHENEGFDEFKDYYKSKTDKYIEFLKNKLPEND